LNYGYPSTGREAYAQANYESFKEEPLEFSTDTISRTKKKEIALPVICK
jgi:hypothetical protein